MKHCSVLHQLGCLMMRVSLPLARSSSSSSRLFTARMRRASAFRFAILIDWISQKIGINIIFNNTVLVVLESVCRLCQLRLPVLSMLIMILLVLFHNHCRDVKLGLEVSPASRPNYVASASASQGLASASASFGSGLGLVHLGLVASNFFCIMYDELST